LAAKAISGATFWTDLDPDITTGGGVALFNDGDVQYAALPADPTQMLIVRRTLKENFSDTVTRDNGIQHFKVAINGNMYSCNSPRLAVFKTLPASDTTPLGLVLSGGGVVDGTSSPNMFFVAESPQVGPPAPGRTTMPAAWTFDSGDPSTTLQTALGGLGPIIQNGIKFGNGNLYGPGVPPGAPLTGQPAAQFLPFLTQRNNNTFISLNARGASVGKVAIAMNNAQDKILLLVQPDGATGITLEVLRDKLAAVNTKNALFGDGSDSVMLFFGGKFVVSMGSRKQSMCTIGLGFK
jgi:hypothetical protein